MLENILKEFRRKFNQLKGLIINNSINFEDAKIEINKFEFALRKIKISLKKNESAFSQSQIRKVSTFESEILEFKNCLVKLYEGVDEENILVKEVKESIPERIHTDLMEEETTLEL